MVVGVMTIVIVGVRISLINNGLPPPSMESFILLDTLLPQQSFAMTKSTPPPLPLKRKENIDGNHTSTLYR